MLIPITKAAELLGYSVSGLRKLVRKRAIQFFQASPNSSIKFRREWLDRFIEERSIKPAVAVRETIKPASQPRMKPRFDPALLDL